jgi:hypothetical protein
LASLNLDEYGTELIYEQHEAAQVAIAIPRAVLVICVLSFWVLDGRCMRHSSAKDAHPYSPLSRVSIVILAYLHSAPATLETAVIGEGFRRAYIEDRKRNAGPCGAYASWYLSAILLAALMH